MLFETQNRLRTTGIKEDKRARLTSVTGQITHRREKRGAAKSKMERFRFWGTTCSKRSQDEPVWSKMIRDAPTQRLPQRLDRRAAVEAQQAAEVAEAGSAFEGKAPDLELAMLFHVHGRDVRPGPPPDR